MAVATPLFDPATGAALPPLGVTVPSGFKFAQLTPSGRGAGLPEFFDPSGRLVTETAPGSFVPTARFQGFPEAGGFFSFAKGFAGFLGALAPFIVGIPALAGAPLGGAAGAAASANLSASEGAAGGSLFGAPGGAPLGFDLGGTPLPDLTGGIVDVPTSGILAGSSAVTPDIATGVNLFGAPGGEPLGFNLGGVPEPDLTGALVNVPESGVLAGGSAALGGAGGFSVAKALKLLPLVAGVISLQGHMGNSDLFTNTSTGANPSGSNTGNLQDPLAGLAGGLAGLLGGAPGGGDGGGGGAGGGELGQRGLTFLPTQGKQTGFLLLALAALAAGGVWFYLKNRKKAS